MLNRSLPAELIQLICRHLKSHGSDKTLASLQQTSRSLYLIATPILYGTIRITSQANTDKFFGAFDLVPTSELYLACQPIENGQNEHPLDLPFPVRLRHRYNLVETLILNAMPFGEPGPRFIKVHQAIKLLYGEHIFPNLTSVSFGFNIAHYASLGWYGSDRPLLAFIILRAPTVKHYCLQYPPTQQTPSSLQGANANDPIQLVKHRSKPGLMFTHLISDVDTYHSTLTCHNATSQRLHSISGGQARIRIGFIHDTSSVKLNDDGGGGDNYNYPSDIVVRSPAWRGAQIASAIVPNLVVSRPQPELDHYPIWTFVRPFANLNVSDTEENRRLVREGVASACETGVARQLTGNHLRSFERRQVRLLDEEESAAEPPCMVCGGQSFRCY